jgi:hypothetical protein
LSLDVHDEHSNLLLLFKGRSIEGERWWELTVELFELRVKTREPKREDIRQLVYVTPKCAALVAYSGESLSQQDGDAC